MDIALSCPQCGAEVDLEEDSLVFHCQFCNTTLKPTGRNQVQSFFFEPKGGLNEIAPALLRAIQKKGISSPKILDSHLVYAPYWRVKGLLFQWAFGKIYKFSTMGGQSFDYFKKLRSVPYHRTFPAFESKRFGLFSLGLRVQAMKMRPYNREKMGLDALLLEQTVDLKEAVQIALKTPTQVVNQPRSKVDFLHTGLIGEGYSLIYFPFFCFSIRLGPKEELVVVDGLSHKVIKGELPLEEISRHTESRQLPYQPLDFIPFQCPNCGWDLPYQPHARVHLCTTCKRAWQEMGGEFQEMEYKISPSATRGSQSIYLPFWRLQVAIHTKEGSISTQEEFFQLFPQYRVSKGPDTKGIYFYVPAFRIRNPVAVDKLAASMTRVQPSIPVSEPEDFEVERAADAWLPLGEAMEMAHLLLYSMTPKRAKRTLTMVKDARVKLISKELLWLPFQEQGIFLRQESTDLAIQKNCLQIH